MGRLVVRTAFACIRMREQRRPPMPRARTLDPGASSTACLGALLRHLRTLQGLTQAGLGAAAGFDGSYVGAVERAAVRPSRDLVERCDRALGAGGVLLACGPRPTPSGSPDRPPPAPATRPPTPRRPDAPRPDAEAEAVLEAMELARRAEACDVGPETLDGIERAVERLGRAASARPPAALIPAVRSRRRYVERLLAGRLTLGRRRRLLVAAGRLSLELARAGQDLAPPASVAALELALDEAQAWASLGDPLA